MKTIVSRLGTYFWLDIILLLWGIRTVISLFCQNNEVILKTLSIVSIALVIVSVLVSFVNKEPKGNTTPSPSLIFYWRIVSYGLLTTAIMDVFERHIQSIFSLGPKYEIVLGLLFLFFIIQFFLLQIVFLKRNIW
jgi:hypothetical protein